MVEALHGWLGSARTLRQIVASIDAPIIANAIAAGERAAAALQTSHGRRSIVAALIEQVKLSDEAIHIVLHRSALAAKLGTAISDAAALHLTIHAAKMRQGKATKLVLATGTAEANSVDASLVQLLTDARAAQRLLASPPDTSIREIAARQRQCRHRLARLVRLSYLAPGIVVDLCEGRQPRTLTPRKLLEADLPMDWAEQRRVLGLG